MSSFDPASVQKAVAEFMTRRPRRFHQLYHAKDVIAELRQKGASNGPLPHAYALEMLYELRCPVTLAGAFNLLSDTDLLTEELDNLGGLLTTPRRAAVRAHFNNHLLHQPEEQLGGVRETIGNYLQFDQFAFSALNSVGKEQQLRLVFATHEDLLRGHSLRRIETAMQRLELSFLAALSGNQRSLIPDGQPVVLEIAAKDTNDDSKQDVAKR